MPTLAAVLMLLIGVVGSAPADVTVSVATQGCYRPGRFFPVRIASTEQSAIEIHAAGAVSATVDVARDGPTTIPLLAETSTLRDLRWVSADGAEHPLPIVLHPLADDDRMIGVVGGDAEAARSLFPKRNVVLVTLDYRPLLQPSPAWESLDAVSFGAAAAAQLRDDQIQMLLAAGTIILVHSSVAPDSRWPWKRSSDHWILRHEVAGPSLAIDPNVYGPTYSWDRGWPRAFRFKLVVAACVFCILALAITLWRSRYAVFAVVMISAMAVGLIALFHSRQSPIRSESLGVAIRTSTDVQYDLWSWRTAVRQTDVTCTAPALTRPIFGALSRLEQTNARLLCRSDGRPDKFIFHLQPQQSLAMLTRLVRPQVHVNALAPVDPRWRQFVQDEYLRPTDQIAGQTLIQDPSSGQSISTVVIDRQ
jgi:hypothetical protein